LSAPFLVCINAKHKSFWKPYSEDIFTRKRENGEPVRTIFSQNTEGEEAMEIMVRWEKAK